MGLKGLVAVAVMISASAFAQDWSTDKYQYGELYEGFVVDKDGRKTEGYIKYQSRYKLQEEVIFYKKKDDTKRTIYDADDLSEYKVADKHYKVINFSGGASVTKMRGNLIVDDQHCIKKYVWYDRAPGYNQLKQRPNETDEEYGNRKFPATYVYYKDGDEMAVTEEFFEKDFTNKMKAYIKDHKELYKKVKAGESGYNKIINMEDVFKEYNEWCDKQ